MESNTFATSAFVAVSEDTAYQYLCRLQNLDEWTLGSRMMERVDEDTWIGTASGYQRTLYYHVRRLEGGRLRGIEWQCGYAYQDYFKSYPVLLFPADYVEPGIKAPGVYLHWVSVIDPLQRTPMIMQGIATVHRSEARALKAALERAAGYICAAPAPYRMETDTIYINAPLAAGAAYLGDVRNMAQWSHLLKLAGPTEPQFGIFRDEYHQSVEVRVTSCQVGDNWLIEQDSFYPDYGMVQRTPALLIPLAHAFGDASVPGFLLHRMTFWRNDAPSQHGKLGIEDFGAEGMNIKRLLEAQAGNMASFALGRSYVPPAGATRASRA